MQLPNPTMSPWQEATWTGASFSQHLQNAGTVAAHGQPAAESKCPIKITSVGASEAKREQAFRRREQNKKSQQTHRARHQPYTRDLVTNLKNGNLPLQGLREENSRMLEALCALRKENDALRRMCIHHGSDREKPCRPRAPSRSAAGNVTVADGCSQRHSLSQAAVGSLQEPFRVMSGLIYSHLDVDANGKDIMAAMEQLQEMMGLEVSAKNAVTQIQQ